MTFQEQLNLFMKELDATGAELAKESGISISTISRYRNGRRIPKPDSDVVMILAKGFERIAKQRHVPGYDKNTLCSSLHEALKSKDDDFDLAILHKKFDSLIDTFDISMQSLAEYLNYDVSHIYRIRKGERKPSDPVAFVQNTADYIVSTYQDADSRRTLISMLSYKYNRNTPPPEKAIDIALQKRLCHWLTDASEYDDLLSDSMFSPTNDFGFSSLFDRRSPSNKKKEPRLIEKREEYIGIEGFGDAVIDFLFNVSRGNAHKDITIYHTFIFHENPNKGIDIYPVMRGLAKVLRQGIHVNLIHGLNQCLRLMVFDYKRWLPAHMTGRLSSYFIENSQEEQSIKNLILTSEDWAFIGNAVAGFENHGRFVVTNDKSEVEYYRNMNQLLLHKATPLADIYTAERQEEFQLLLERQAKVVGERRTYLSEPPLHTISDNLLNKILADNKLSLEESEKIRSHVLQARRQITERLLKGKITEFLPFMSETDAKKHPPKLFLSDIFPNKYIYYTYPEYKQHIDETFKFAANTANYSCEPFEFPTFHNTRTIMDQGSGVFTSSNRIPSVHLAITHPKMCRLIERIPIFTRI